MTNLSEIRQKYPEYNDMSDKQFADKFHDKFYSDIPIDQYYQKIGFSDKSTEVPRRTQDKSFLEKSGELAQKYITNPIESSGLPNVAGGLIQGTANMVPGIENLFKKGTNLIPGVNLEESQGLDFVPHGLGSTIGNVLSYLVPNPVGYGLGATKMAEHLTKIPQIANVLKKSADIIGKSPSVVQKMLKGSASLGKNALDVASRSPDDQGTAALLGAGGKLVGNLMGVKNPFIGALARAGGGAGLGYALGGQKGAEEGAGAALIAPKAFKMFFGEGKPGQEALKDLNYESVIPSVEAGKRLGTPLRPSEASQNPFTARTEGSFARTSKAASEDVKQGMERIKHEKGAVNKLLSTIYDKSTASDNKIKSLYDKAYQWNVKPEVINAFKEDPVISNAFDTVRNNKIWQRKLKGVPENNYAYLDKVKKVISNEEGKLMKSGANEEARELTSARHDMESVLDSSNPAYKNARAEAQKQIVRKQLERKLNKGEINGKSFYNKFIKNENNFNDLITSLKNVPEAQKQLQDMKLAWHSLINVEKPSTAAYQSKSAIDQARGKLNEIVQIWNEVTGSKRNEKAIKYIRGNDWIKDLKDLNNVKDKELKESKISTIFSRIIPGIYNAKGNQ